MGNSGGDTTNMVVSRAMRWCWALLAGTCILIASSPLSLAASIAGTIGFNISGTVTTTSSNLTSAVNFTNVRTNSSSQGDWNAFSSNVISGGLLATSAASVAAYDADGLSFSFSDAGFGSFTGTILADDHYSYPFILFEYNVRVLRVTGLFTPGTTLISSGWTDTVLANVNLVFSGINGGARTGSMTMATAVIPEPSTLLGISAGALALFGFSKKRRRR